MTAVTKLDGLMAWLGHLDASSAAGRDEIVATPERGIIIPMG
jgi:hypothetical protein